MAKRELSAEQKRLNVDLWIIVAISLAALGAYILLQEPLDAFGGDASIPILLRMLPFAAFQFGLAGLGICVVCAIRKENLFSHGLHRKGALASIAWSALCFVPTVLFRLATGQLTGYLPFQQVSATREILGSGAPNAVIGMLIIAVAWGFFEGFNYVVISDKINRRFPSKNRWLNWGAIVCAVLCILIHDSVGITPDGIFDMVTTLIIIYGMLVVRDVTGNAWGSVFVFVFLWNAT